MSSSTSSPSSAPTCRWWLRSGSCCPRPCSRRRELGFVNLHFSLLPALARRGPGRAGDPRRRRRDRRVRDGARRGHGHRSRLRTRRDPDRKRRDRGRPAGSGSSRSGRRCCFDTLDHLPDLDAHAPDRVTPRTRPSSTSTSSVSTGRSAADDLARIVRAGNPRPGAWTELDGARFKVLRRGRHRHADPRRAPGVVERRPAMSPPAPAACSSSKCNRRASRRCHPMRGLPAAAARRPGSTRDDHWHQRPGPRDRRARARRGRCVRARDAPT